MLTKQTDWYRVGDIIILNYWLSIISGKGWIWMRFDWLDCLCVSVAWFVGINLIIKSVDEQTIDRVVGRRLLNSFSLARVNIWKHPAPWTVYRLTGGCLYIYEKINKRRRRGRCQHPTWGFFSGSIEIGKFIKLSRRED